jgi:uncharacterized integral membrane protein
MSGKTLIIIILVVIITIFSLQNTHTAEVNILFWKASYPLIILIYAILGVGFVAGYSAKRFFRIRKKETIDDNH